MPAVHTTGVARQPLPWVRLRTGPVADHVVLRVHEDVFRDPRDGSEHKRAIIDAGEWCNVLPLTREGRAVLVTQYRFGSTASSLEVPGGIVEPGEDPSAAAARELEEETGYRAQRLVALGWVWANPAHFTNRVHFFVGEGCERVHDGVPEGGEDLAVELRDYADLAELVREGAITHPFSLCALYLEVLARSKVAVRPQHERDQHR